MRHNKITFGLSALLLSSSAVFAQGNHVFTGAEANNFGILSLSTTPGGQTWSTFRGAAPGYFSAVGAATYTGAADANANVDGYVKYYASTSPAASFTFPIGTGSDLRALTISGTIPTNGQYATAWILGDPSDALDPTSTGAPAGAHSVTSVTSPIVNVSNIGQWDWQDLSGDAAGITVTVSIPELSVVHPSATAANLRLVGWNGSSWVDLSGAANATGISENSTLSGTMIAGITAIGIGSIDVALPVTLLSFEGTAKACDAVLSWQVAKEENFSRYEVAYSQDARSFEKVGEVAASGKEHYQFSHVQSNGQGYYRLKMVKHDGTFTYSENVVVVKADCQSSVITIYPNPAKDQLYITGATEGSKVMLVNAIGQVVIENTIDNNTKSVINVSHLAPGYYNVIVENGTKRFVSKLVKEK